MASRLLLVHGYCLLISILLYLPPVHANYGNTLDQNDESLNRWKASLGLGTGTPIGDASDPRKCIIKSLALESEGREDITIDLSAPEAVDTLKDKPFTIKEGSTFRIKATFVVQHEVLSGLKYVQVVKRKGVKVSKDEEMLVSSWRAPWPDNQRIVVSKQLLTV